MKSSFALLLIFVFISGLMHAQCNVDVFGSTQVKCGDSVQLSVNLKLSKVYDGDLSLDDVYFADVFTGYVVGLGGKILKTSDGGISWTPHDFMTLRWSRVCFIDSQHGFIGHIASNTGRVAYTSDGGDTWTLTNFSSPDPLWDLAMLNPTTCIVVGENGLIKKTINSGQIWENIESGVNETFNVVVFPTETTGYICTEQGSVLKSTDGGNTWTKLVTGQYMPALRCASFLNENIGYVAGGLWRVYKTTDGGITWSWVSGNDDSFVGEYGCSFADENIGYFVGTYSWVGKYYGNSEDKWDSFKTDAGDGTFSSVWALGTQKAIATTYNGEIYACYDAYSYAWQPAESLSSPTIRSPYASPLENTTYTVSVTRVNGCTSTDTITVEVLPAELMPEICVVTVEENNKNRILWNPQLPVNADSVCIFRESNITGEYELIATFGNETPGSFTDSLSDALIRSNRYTIAFKDHCQFQSILSLPHKTMHLSINQGIENSWNLIWEPYSGLEVNTYNIYRGNNSSNMNLIASLSGINTQYTDYDAPQGSVYYQVEAIGSSGCSSAKDNVSSNSNIASFIQNNIFIPSICNVSTESDTKHTKIIWDRPVSSTLDSIIIYRESEIAGEFNRLASIPLLATSEYIDTLSHIDDASYRYRLTSLDHNLNESAPGTTHQSIYLRIQKGTNTSWHLNWNEYAGAEVNSYIIYRGNSSAELQQIAILSAGNTQYTDLLAPEGDIYYQIEAELNQVCASITGHPISSSNIATNKVNGYSDLEFMQITISPNPFSDFFMIHNAFSNKSINISISDLTNHVIKTEIIQTYKRIDTRHLSPGIYFLLIETDGLKSCKKIIKM